MTRRLLFAGPWSKSDTCDCGNGVNMHVIRLAARTRIGWITVRWMNAPTTKPISRATMNASHKLPVDSSVAQASTVPTTKKSPCARLTMSRKAEDDCKTARDQRNNGTMGIFSVLNCESAARA